MEKIIKNKIFINYIYNSLYQLLLIAVPIITIPYVSRILGAQGLGIYGYTYSVAQFFYILGVFGINSYGSRQIAYVRNSKKQTTNEFWSIWLLQCISSTIGLFVYSVITVALNIFNYKEAFLLQIPVLLNAIFDISWLFIAMEDFKKTVTRNILIKIVGLILIFIFIKDQSNINTYIIINSSIVFLGSSTLWIFIKEYIGKFNFKHLNIRKHIKGAFFMLIPQLSMQIYTSLDRTTIGLLSDVTQVGYYDQAQKIARIILAIVTSLSVVLMPRIANMYARNDIKKVEEYIIKSMNFTLVSSVFLMSLVMGISKNFVPWFFGDEFEIIVPYMIITSLLIFFIPLGGVFANQYTLPTNKNKEYIIPLVSASIINLLMNFILVPNFKALGGVISIVVTELMVCIMRVFLVRKYLNLKNIFKNTLIYYIAGIACGTSVYFIGNIINYGFCGLAIQSIVGLVVYSLFIYFINNPIKNEVVRITNLKNKKDI